MSKEIINNKDVVFAHYAKRNPEKLAQRKAQYEEALKKGTNFTKEFTERLALINETLGIAPTKKTREETVTEPVVSDTKQVKTKGTKGK